MSNPDRRANRLQNETSPYLLQHAYNPVDWYPWGDEALAKARELNRPIFLSVGYSSCHWCHVMERESFEDERTAQLMNDQFINIKVDREERPDVDALYMSAVQLLTGSGGWPMSVFLTPDLRPFYGGTYFPPVNAHGRPSFAQVLTTLAQFYRDTPERIEESAATITEKLRSMEAPPLAGELPAADAVDGFVRYTRRSFDEEFGGFGGAPKFPRSVDLSVLLRVHVRSNDETARAHCETTLDCMARGGMYDQVGGGFHRYSVDRYWLVPHFEKMLYDNALLARTYLEAYQLTKKPLYERIAREVLDYVAREMTSPEGGFYSATDADSEGEEGKYFVWTPDEVAEVVGEAEARAFCAYYGVTPSGNFEHGTSIPHVAKSLDETATALNMEVSELETALTSARTKLYAKRTERVPPLRDDKVITAWNALMLSSFARAGAVLGESKYIDAATTAMAFLRERMWRDGELYRTYKDERWGARAFLDDYAYAIEAAIDVYESTFDRGALAWALELTEVLESSFLDPAGGGYFYTGDDYEELLCRKRDYLDNATPAGNGVMALSLLRLELLTGETRFRARAAEILAGAAQYVEKAPMACGYLFLALDFFHGSPVEIAVIGERAIARPLLEALHCEFIPARVIAGRESSPPDGNELPLLEGRGVEEGEATAFVCRNRACREPTGDPARLRVLLRE